MSARVVEPNQLIDYLRTEVKELKRLEKKANLTIEMDEHGDMISIAPELQFVYDYLDVFGFDQTLGLVDLDGFKLTDKTVGTEVMLIEEDGYIGHIYFWERDDVLSAVGIRKSLFTKKKGVARIIINALIGEARRRGRKAVIILNPLDIMIDILVTMDFKEHAITKSEREYTLLSRSTQGYIYRL